MLERKLRKKDMTGCLQGGSHMAKDTLSALLGYEEHHTLHVQIGQNKRKNKDIIILTTRITTPLQLRIVDLLHSKSPSGRM